MSGRKSTKTEYVCKACGKSFLAYQIRTKRNSHRFCSRECYRDNRNLCGQTFGRWTAIFRAPYDRNGKSMWVCKCNCGNVRIVSSCNLCDKSSTSCGCYKKDCKATHGYSRKHDMKSTYRVWVSMRQRCNNINNPEYESYGGRGIYVCERWSSFKNFLEDMGEKPPGMSIDRFPDQNGNYEKSNCRWATTGEQNRNTRRNHIITFNGETRCLTDWAEILGIRPVTLSGRLATGWSIERAFTTKARAHVRNPKQSDDGWHLD